MTLDVGCGLGLGAMRLSEVDASRALRIVHEALDRGVRLFDTADVYAPSAEEVGHNERLLAEALGGRGVVATKGGLRREGKKWIPDGRAKHLKTACESSLKALGVEHIELYQLHALDPKVPLATSVRALSALQQQGKIRRIGLCNVRLEDIEAAREIVPIDAVQVELNPLAQAPLKNGVIPYCARHRIRVIAHSPLGGHRRTKRIRKLPVLSAIAKRHGVSAHEVALVWLRGVDPIVLPIPGATRVESLVSSLHALDVVLTDEDWAALDDAHPAGRSVRSPPTRAPAGGGREVALFMGYPGAGKSTLAQSWRGYTRLNRDTEGGTLAELVPELDRRLAEGDKRVVLDNTYPRRDTRFDVIETARRHGVPVRCVWLETTLEQSQVNAVRRMVNKHGRLLQPEEMKSSPDPNDFGPEAQFRYRRELDPPRGEEGFSEIERVPFVADEMLRTVKAVFVDEIGPTDVLRRYADDGYRIIRLVYDPGGRDARGSTVVDGVAIDVLACTHPPGRALCWCRKPLPGLGVVCVETFELDAGQCIIVGTSAADRGFADRLGLELVSPESFYQAR